MSTPPKTVLQASDEEAEAIRDAVRAADLASLGPGRVRADLSHVPGLVALLADARVSDPIYDLPGRSRRRASPAGWPRPRPRPRRWPARGRSR